MHASAGHPVPVHAERCVLLSVIGKAATATCVDDHTNDVQWSRRYTHLFASEGKPRRV